MLVACQRGASRGSSLYRAFVAGTVQQRCRSSASELDSAIDKYYDNELAYTNFPVDKVQFNVAKDFRDSAVPAISFDGGAPTTGLRHLVPWAKVKYAAAGHKGNLGRKEYNSDQRMTNPALAKQEIQLGLAPLDDDVINKHMAGYFKWVRALEDKLAVHITESLSSYRPLNNKYKSFASKEIFLANMSLAVKSRKDVEGEVVPDSEFMTFSHKLFTKTKREVDVAKIQLEIDRQIYDEHKLVRRNTLWFDARGDLIPVASQGTRPGDILCLDVSLEPSMYETFYGLKARFTRVFILSRASIPKRVHQMSPFGNLEEAMG